MANPLTGVLDLVRFCFFATPISNFVGVASICVLAPLSFLMGIKTFARIESKVVDQA
jgi:ABC-type polysaccharide/polyol phosphate export permease